MHGIPTRAREKVTFLVTPDEREQLDRLLRRLRRHGDYCLTDICRTATARVLRSTRSQGTAWLARQIQEAKEGLRPEAQAGTQAPRGTGECELDHLAS